MLLLSDADLALLCAGQLSPERAFMTGRLAVRGNLLRAMRCGAIFELLRPRLPTTTLTPSTTTTAARRATKTWHDPRSRPRLPRPPQDADKIPLARL